MQTLDEWEQWRKRPAVNPTLCPLRGRHTGGSLASLRTGRGIDRIGPFRHSPPRARRLTGLQIDDRDQSNTDGLLHPFTRGGVVAVFAASRQPADPKLSQLQSPGPQLGHAVSRLFPYVVPGVLAVLVKLKSGNNKNIQYKPDCKFPGTWANWDTSRRFAPAMAARRCLPHHYRANRSSF